jgi:hypothetical protein
MSVILISAVFLAGNVFDAKLEWPDLIAALCGIALIPAVISGFSWLFGKFGGRFLKSAAEK